MKKPALDSKPEFTDEKSSGRATWSAPVRRIVSVALIFQIIVQFFATWTGVPANRSGNHSPIGNAFRHSPVYPYVVAANLNQPYRFFAPDPGPSHVIKYELFDKKGKAISLDSENETTGFLPPVNLRVPLLSGMPRLLYHRYFMLTENVPTRIEEDAPPKVQEDQRKRLEITMNSYAQELMRRNNAARITMEFLSHEPPPLELFNEKQLSLSEKESYDVLWKGEFTRTPPAN